MPNNVWLNLEQNHTFMFDEELQSKTQLKSLQHTSITIQPCRGSCFSQTVLQKRTVN